MELMPPRPRLLSGWAVPNPSDRSLCNQSIPCNTSRVKLLILGGTEFLGRYLVHAALSRGHEITLFNRGQTNPHLFPDVEKLRGDRGGDLSALEGRSWHAAIDTCGYASSKVRATAGLLSASIGHYTFISSISVYRDFTIVGLDETGPVATLDAPEDETNDESYGARKVLCERAAEEMMPGRVLSVRAGLIVGPYAGIDRFPYWLRRMAQGGEVLAPGSPEAAVQLIDVRDLAEWVITMAEARSVGIFNATGPPKRLTFQQMLEHCHTFAAPDTRITWVDEDFLIAEGVVPFSELPLWLPKGSYPGFFAIDCRRAWSNGLSCRSLTDTARDTLLWDRERNHATEPPKRPTVLAEGRIGLTPEREQQLLHKWKTRVALG